MILRKNIYKIMSVFLCISALSGCTDKNMDLYKNDKEVKKTVDDSNINTAYNAFDYTQYLSHDKPLEFTDGFLSYKVYNATYKDGVLKFDVAFVADKYDVSDSRLLDVHFSDIKKNKLIPFKCSLPRNLFSLKKGSYFVASYEAKVPKSGVLVFDSNSFTFKFNYRF